MIIAKFLLIFSMAFAGGNESGNGGGGYYCPYESSKVWLLDYAEAGGSLDPYYDFAFSKKSIWDFKAADLISRFEKFNPERASLYKTWLQEFIKAASFVSGPLAQIDDQYFALDIHLRCTRYVQIAIQMHPNTPIAPRYIIDKGAWDLMDDNQKAGLVLHELVYRELLSGSVPLTESMEVRNFVRALTSESARHWNLESYISTLEGAFESAQIQNGIKIALAINDPQATKFWNVNTVREAHVVDQRYYTRQGQWVHLKDQKHFQFLENGDPVPGQF